MIFDIGWQKERMIRSTLVKRSRQRVALTLQPGDVWVIEQAIVHNDNLFAKAHTLQQP